MEPVIPCANVTLTTAAAVPERSHGLPTGVPSLRARSGKMVLVAVAALVATQVALVNVRWGDTPAPTLPPPAPADGLGRAVDPTTVIADPDVLVGRRSDYLYSSATGYSPPYLPVRTFRRLGRWGRPTDAMPVLPAWADSWIWNPDVRWVDGRYVMWFTAPLKGAALPTTRGPPRCLGWATSSSPLGPFHPAARPSVCQIGWFGAIDPQTLMAPGGHEWLYWKSDGNSVPRAHKPTVIWAEPLAANGVTLRGRPTAILSDRQPWEGTVVESPQMVRNDGHYYLFFSGNVSGSTLMGIGMARCRGPAGPCANRAAGPWLGSPQESRPVGEESLFSQDGATWLLYSPKGVFQTLMVSMVAFGPRGPYVAAFDRLPAVR